MKSAKSNASTPSVPKKPGSTLGEVARQTVLRARQGHLSVPRQVLEMIVLRLFYGIGPGFYHTTRFWRKELSWDFKTGFYPYSKFRRIVAAINPPSYQKMSQDKVCEKAILQLSGIPTPRFFGHLHPQRGLSRTGSKLTNAQELLSMFLEVQDAKKVCFKLVEGFGGFGFQAVEVVRDSELTLRVLESNELLSVDEFFNNVLTVNQGASYIIEEYISQHPDLAALNKSSVNTIRVWACCVDGGTVAIDAFLRVGGQGSLVDNTSRGAHIFKLDLESGVIGDGMVKNIYNHTFQSHRDSGEKISGRTLPFWPETLSLAQRAVAAFPHLNFAGLDVAITENGPVIIELNVEPDPTSAIIFDRPHRDLLSPLDSFIYGTKRDRSIS